MMTRNFRPNRQRLIEAPLDKDTIYLVKHPLVEREPESFNNKQRNELLNGEILYTLQEAKI